MDAPVLLTGATGYIGGRPLRHFEEAGRLRSFIELRNTSVELISLELGDRTRFKGLRTAMCRR